MAPNVIKLWHSLPGPALAFLSGAIVQIIGFHRGRVAKLGKADSPTSLSEFPVESIIRGYWNPWPRHDR